MEEDLRPSCPAGCRGGWGLEPAAYREGSSPAPDSWCPQAERGGGGWVYLAICSLLRVISGWVSSSWPSQQPPVFQAGLPLVTRSFFGSPPQNLRAREDVGQAGEAAAACWGSEEDEVAPAPQTPHPALHSPWSPPVGP